MPNWNSAIYYKGNLLIYEIITWHVEQTISLLIWFFFARLTKLESCAFSNLTNTVRNMGSGILQKVNAKNDNMEMQIRWTKSW